MKHKCNKHLSTTVTFLFHNPKALSLSRGESVTFSKLPAAASPNDSGEQPRHDGLADWLFPPYLTQQRVDSSVTSENRLRATWGYCACTVFVWGEHGKEEVDWKLFHSSVWFMELQRRNFSSNTLVVLLSNVTRRLLIKWYTEGKEILVECLEPWILYQSKSCTADEPASDWRKSTPAEGPQTIMFVILLKIELHFEPTTFTRKHFKFGYTVKLIFSTQNVEFWAKLHKKAKTS